MHRRNMAENDLHHEDHSSSDAEFGDEMLSQLYYIKDQMEMERDSRAVETYSLKSQDQELAIHNDGDEEEYVEQHEAKYQDHDRVFQFRPMDTQQFQNFVLNAGNFSVAGIWKNIWKSQMKGMQNPRPGRTNRSICRLHKKLACSMAFKTVKMTLTRDYLVIQGSKDLVRKARRGLLAEGILDDTYNVPNEPDHIHELLPLKSLQNLTDEEASDLLIQLVRGHSDVPMGHFEAADIPSLLYEPTSSVGKLMWKIFPWQSTVLSDIRLNARGAKRILQQLHQDVYYPAMLEDRATQIEEEIAAAIPHKDLAIKVRFLNLCNVFFMNLCMLSRCYHFLDNKVFFFY